MKNTNTITADWMTYKYYYTVIDANGNRKKPQFLTDNLAEELIAKGYTIAQERR